MAVTLITPRYDFDNRAVITRVPGPVFLQKIVPYRLFTLTLAGTRRPSIVSPQEFDSAAK